MKKQLLLTLLSSLFLISGCANPSSSDSGDDKDSGKGGGESTPSVVTPSGETSTPSGSESPTPSGSGEVTPSEVTPSESEIPSSGEATPSQSEEPSEATPSGEPSVSPSSSETPTGGEQTPSVPSTPSEVTPSASEEPSVEPSESVEPTLETLTFNMKGFSNGKTYPVEVPYSKDMFDISPNVISYDLAKIAFGFSVIESEKDQVEALMGQMGFSTIIHNELDIKPTKDTIGYSIGTLNYNDENTVLVSLRGFDYGEEWQANFEIGESGYHDGFYRGATKVLDGLKAYLLDNQIAADRFIFTGYSRAGAIANVAGNLLATIDSNVLASRDYQVYTFEAPNGVDSEHLLGLNNIFNFVNSADFVARIPSSSWDLHREGVDIEIYSSDIDTLLTALDEELVIPELIPDDADPAKFTTDVELCNYLESMFILKEGEEPAQNNIKTRESYYTVYQGDLSYLIGLVFSLDEATLADLKALINMEDPNIIWTIIGYLQEDGLYNAVKPILDEHEVVYDDALLKQATNTMALKLMEDLGSKHAYQLVYLILSNKMDDLKRAIFMHYQESTYVLLENYFEGLDK